MTVPEPSRDMFRCIRIIVSDVVVHYGIAWYYGNHLDREVMSCWLYMMESSLKMRVFGCHFDQPFDKLLEYCRTKLDGV